MIREFQFDAWRIVCDPDDGGRLQALSWRGQELLTPPPAVFRLPPGDFGRYETRPVHGYDDCFPTVDACRLADPPLEAPDHGEVCWLPARVVPGAGVLRTSWTCRAWPGEFAREMRVDGDVLTWRFTVTNTGRRAMPWMHVMHALMPPAGIVALRLPGCREILDEVADTVLSGAAAASPAERLLAVPEGESRMWLLRGVTEGRAEVAWRSGRRLRLRFPADRFPTLGLWWNRRGYPGGADTRRDEFALEPIPGPYSSLARCAAAGQAPAVAPGETVCWDIGWEMETTPQ